MPLSKKKQAEWMRNYRAGVIPKSSVVIPKLEAWEVTSWTLEGARYVKEHPFAEIPNYPDGRHRDATE